MFKYPNALYFLLIPAILFIILGKYFQNSIFNYLGVLSISLIILFNSIYGIIKKKIWARNPLKLSVQGLDKMYYGNKAVSLGLLGIAVWIIIIFLYIWLFVL